MKSFYFVCALSGSLLFADIKSADAQSLFFGKRSGNSAFSIGIGNSGYYGGGYGSRYNGYGSSYYNNGSGNRYGNYYGNSSIYGYSNSYYPYYTNSYNYNPYWYNNSSTPQNYSNVYQGYQVLPASSYSPATSLTNPQSVTQAGYSSNATSTTLTIMLPDENAELWLGDTQMSSTGAERRISMPQLSAGTLSSYIMTARWISNGKTVVKKLDVEFRGGEDTIADFRK